MAAALGVLAGWATGGRLGHISRHPLDWLPLLAVGVALPVVAELGSLDGAAGLALVLASFACLLGFCLLNLRLVGMGVVAVGLSLNALVIALNGAMPVRAAALVRAGVAEDARDAATLDLGVKRRLATDGDRLAVLGDVLPVRPLRQVLSFGDLIVAAGTIDLVANLMRRRRPRRAGDGQHGRRQDGPEGGGQRGGRLPLLWKPTPKRIQRPSNAPAGAGAATPGSSVVSSAGTSVLSRRAGQAGASGGRSKASAPGS